MATGYDWAGHVKSVARLLHADGSGWTNKAVYALDRSGRAVTFLDPGAVAWTLLGANATVLYDAGTPATVALHIRRTEIMMKLYAKAGIPLIAKSHATTALIKFNEVAEWADVEKVLRAAYAIARKVQG